MRNSVPSVDCWMLLLSLHGSIFTFVPVKQVNWVPAVLYPRFSLSTCAPQDPEAAIRCGSWVVADSPASDEAAFFVESDAWDPTSIDPSAKWLSWNSTDWVAPEVCRSLLFLHISCDFLASRTWAFEDFLAVISSPIFNASSSWLWFTQLLRKMLFVCFSSLVEC